MVPLAGCSRSANKYATTSEGAIVGIFVAGLMAQGSIPSACTSRCGFSHSWPSVMERYLAGSAGGMRFFSVDVEMSEAVCKLVVCEQ